MTRPDLVSHDTFGIRDTPGPRRLLVSCPSVPCGRLSWSRDLHRVSEAPFRLLAMETIQMENEHEWRAFGILESTLAGTPYIASHLVPVRKVMRPQPDDELWEGERRMLRWGEFDFVIHERRTKEP